MSKSALVWPRSVVVDSGVFVAAIDADERAHAWAKRALTAVPGFYFTCEACITEAIHILGNSGRAVARLEALLSRVTIVSFVDNWRSPLSQVISWAPDMDFADACVVHLVSQRRESFALTVDHADFARYRVPFASPAGDFY